MVEGLIALLIAIVVVAILAGVIIWCIDMLPIDGRFKLAARALVAIIAVLVILVRALPLLGVAI